MKYKTKKTEAQDCKGCAFNRPDNKGCEKPYALLAGKSCTYPDAIIFVEAKQ